MYTFVPAFIRVPAVVADFCNVPRTLCSNCLVLQMDVLMERLVGVRVGTVPMELVDPND